ncbi:putative pantoate-beta-alanine ligase [Lyophyllum shimeji]|uniref:Pantoate--beta-alanine ligase n=1 Tax=Lyophyllum shimeji TaxID=47721 RepID=A0A9P3URS5_LYOSH|nr:putative pantoate-beta-alanine ligase [Lyophyllum shimeji]
MQTAVGTQLPPSSIPIYTTVAAYREWRRRAFEERRTVGFVPTMGALHEGHISLVKRSLAENDLTVVSIFVNPAQFAPHEDLATYPRTLPQDLEKLSMQSYVVSDPESTGASTIRKPSAVFLPSVSEMYPSGISQDTAEQKGTFVEVKGYSHQMEGKTRPTFFRGVATVVTKLFNAIEPTNAYFGQKDIQQGLLLRRLARDLLLSHPDHEHIHIVPTARDPSDELALSSRNAYLTADGRRVAATLREALQAAEAAWLQGFAKSECVEKALQVVESRKSRASAEGLHVELRLDYVELNNADDFEVVDPQTTKNEMESRPVILSGALWVDKTRLIDNIILGEANRIVG